jgi:hypothetical protein
MRRGVWWAAAPQGPRGGGLSGTSEMFAELPHATDPEVVKQTFDFSPVRPLCPSPSLGFQEETPDDVFLLRT